MPNGEESNVQTSPGSAMRELREKASGLTEDVRELASTAGSAVREQLDPIETYVMERPLRALLIAAGVGMVLGFMFRR